MIQMHWKHLVWWLAGGWNSINTGCYQICFVTVLVCFYILSKGLGNSPRLWILNCCSAASETAYSSHSHISSALLFVCSWSHIFGVQMMKQREEWNGCRQSFYWDICYSQMEMPWPQAGRSATPPKKLEVTEKSGRDVAAKSAFLHPSFKEGSQSREGSCLARVWAKLGAAHCLALTTRVRQVCWMLPHAYSYCILNSRPMGEPQVPIYLQPCLLCCESTERRIWLP